MYDPIIGVFLAGAVAMAVPERGPFAPPFPSKASLDENGIAQEYRRPIEARGVAPNWVAHVQIGEVRIRIEQRPETRIPLLTPYKCFVVGCEGVMIEQAVAHGHHGVSIIKEPCKFEGSDQTYPYRVTVSVLRSPADTVGVTYIGCGRPAAS